jgi:hypothetical protein
MCALAGRAIARCVGQKAQHGLNGWWATVARGFSGFLRVVPMRTIVAFELRPTEKLAVWEADVMRGRRSTWW